MEPKTTQKSSSSSSTISYGGKINNQELSSEDHWNFLEEIEAPMWADLSVCDLTDEASDDAWFDVSHEFHQLSSRQLISTVFHSTNLENIQEPPSPKLPASVSKSRGKSYKIKLWEQGKCKAVPYKQHPVKTLTKTSYVRTQLDDKTKPISRPGKLKETERLRACSSSGSNTSYLSGNAKPISSSSSVTKQDQQHEHENSSRSTLTSDHSKHQEKKCIEVSFQTSSERSKLLSSLKNNFRSSYAMRPVARVVSANGGRSSEGSSSNPSVGPPSSRRYVPGAVQKNIKTLKAPTSTVGSLSNRQRNNMVASKVTTKEKVQQHASFGKVLMARNNNTENQRIGRENVKEGIRKRTTSTMVACSKDKSVAKTDQPTVRVQKASMQSMTQKTGPKKLIGLKERTTNRSKDIDTAKPARKVYFR